MMHTETLRLLDVNPTTLSKPIVTSAPMPRMLNVPWAVFPETDIGSGTHNGSTGGRSCAWLTDALPRARNRVAEVKIERMSPLLAYPAGRHGVFVNQDAGRGGGAPRPCAH